MSIAKLYSGQELTKGDFLAIPGLTVRIPIDAVLADPDGSWTIITNTTVSINLPNSDRKIWAVKKADHHA